MLQGAGSGEWQKDGGRNSEVEHFFIAEHIYFEYRAAFASVMGFVEKLFSFSFSEWVTTGQILVA